MKRVLAIGVLLVGLCRADMAAAQGDIAKRLASTGELRVGLIGSNAVLITRGPDGQYRGIAVELAQRLAAKLGVPLKMIPHETAGLYAESLKTGGWDLVMSGRDPTRAEFVVFSDPYLEIESLYLARPGLDLESADQVDRAGTRIVVISGGSQDNYLSRSLKQATLVRVKNGAEAKEALLSGRADVLGATGPGVYALAAEVAGSNVLAGRFSIVEQTIGLPKRNADLLTYIGEFLRDAKESGFVADQIRRAGLKGVRPAP